VSTITVDRAVLEQALEALDAGVSVSPKSVLHDRLRAALPCTYKCEAWPECACAAQQEQEPVAWMVYTQDGKSVCVTDNPADFTDEHRALPLYTAPPRREWQGLTEEEREQATGWSVEHIEGALKEKNYE